MRDFALQVAWDYDLVTWLNITVLDNVDELLLEEYIDLLRHLKRRCASCFFVVAGRKLTPGPTTCVSP